MSNKVEQNEAQKKSRLRSPNFPYLSLGPAIDKLAIIYSKDKLAATSADVILSHLGYKQAHGSSRRVLSALRQYGLLEEKSEGLFKVSNVGYEILHTPEDSPRQHILLKDAALQPYYFRRVLEEYKGDLPSDATLKSYLVLRESFNPDGADQFVRTLRETVEFANITTADFIDDDKGRSEKNSSSHLPQGSFFDQIITGFAPKSDSQKSSTQSPPLAAPSVPMPQQGLPEDEANESVLAFRISRDSRVRVIFSGEVTQEAIEKLTLLLENSKDTFPTKEELEKSKREKPRPAVWHNEDHDVPVNVTGSLGIGQDSKEYMSIEGSTTGVPADKLEYKTE